MIARRVPLLVVLLALAGLACLDPIVGVECADSFDQCGDTCVDLQTSPDNCGACGVRCDVGQTCGAGMCVAVVDGGPDASVVDGGPDAALFDAGPDATLFDAGPDGMPADAGPDATLFDAGPDGMPADAGPDATLFDAGPDGMPADAAPDAAIDGGPLCMPPESNCGGMCTDTATDPDNCGVCGFVCSSGLCSSGDCVGDGAGEVVVIGHSYQESRVGMNRLVGNAVFRALGVTVDVVVFADGATAAAIAGTDAAIDQVATETGRSWQKTTATAAQVPTAIMTADVFLIYAQENASDATLGALATAWATPLNDFIDGGGIIILLEGGGSNSGTFQLLGPAGLFAASGRTVIVDAILSVVAPNDSVATNVPFMYFGEQTTVRFDTAEPGVVVDDGVGPVVLHKTVQ